MNDKTKKLTILAMMAALAYLVMMVFRIPIVLFLKYEPKDVIITIGGFLYGPVAAFGLSLIVSLLEMVTVSDTGIIGMIMNLISTCSFSCVAAFIYQKRRTLKGAVLGLCAGVVSMVAVMMLWNYLITPIYMHYPREQVAALLLPAFLPFNLLKGTCNAALTMILYKPVVRALRQAGLVQMSSGAQTEGKRHTGVFLVSLLLLATCIVGALVLSGVI